MAETRFEYWARSHNAYRVEFTSRDVPQCYKRLAIRDLELSARVIWVRRRKTMLDLLACDHGAKVEKHQIRRCNICGRLMIGMAAQVRERQEAEAAAAGVPVGPCGSMCK